MDRIVAFNLFAAIIVVLMVSLFARESCEPPKHYPSYKWIIGGVLFKQNGGILTITNLNNFTVHLTIKEKTYHRVAGFKVNKQHERLCMVEALASDETLTRGSFASYDADWWDGYYVTVLDDQFRLIDEARLPITSMF